MKKVYKAFLLIGILISLLVSLVFPFYFKEYHYIPVITLFVLITLYIIHILKDNSYDG
jgi:hypothetical protein